MDVDIIKHTIQFYSSMSKITKFYFYPIDVSTRLFVTWKKNVSLFQQKYCIYDFNDTSNKAGADSDVYTFYDEFVYKAEMCKEIINIKDGLLESSMSKVEC